MFFGREKELAHLRSHFMRQAVQNYLSSMGAGGLGRLSFYDLFALTKRIFSL